MTISLAIRRCPFHVRRRYWLGISWYDLDEVSHFASYRRFFPHSEMRMKLGKLLPNEGLTSFHYRDVVVSITVTPSIESIGGVYTPVIYYEMRLRIRYSRVGRFDLTSLKQSFLQKLHSIPIRHRIPFDPDGNTSLCKVYCPRKDSCSFRQ